MAEIYAMRGAHGVLVIEGNLYFSLQSVLGVEI